jgi:hypothetical protein
MILHKKLSADEVLELIATVVGKYLPDNIQGSDAELNLTFNDDHSIEIYLMNLPEDDNNAKN